MNRELILTKAPDDAHWATMSKGDSLPDTGGARKPSETRHFVKEKRGTKKICPPCVVGTTNMQKRPQAYKFELFWLFISSKFQVAARTRREVLPRLLRVTSPPMWSITTGGRSGNLATNSSFPPMLST